MWRAAIVGLRASRSQIDAKIDESRPGLAARAHRQRLSQPQAARKRTLSASARKRYSRRAEETVGRIPRSKAYAEEGPGQAKAKQATKKRKLSAAGRKALLKRRKGGGRRFVRQKPLGRTS